MFAYGQLDKRCLKKKRLLYGNIEPPPREKKNCGKKDPHFFFLACGEKMAQKNRLRRKMLRAQNRVLRCAQPASRRLLRKTVFDPNVQRDT